MPEHFRIIGKSQVRKDARAKVTGNAQYIADMDQDSVFYGVLIRSPHHFARIKSIETTIAENSAGVLRVITAKDIPGNKIHGPLIQDQPVLALDIVRHVGEPVVLLVAESKAEAIKASSLVHIDYEPLKPVFDPVTALKPEVTELHPDGNLAADYDISDGDVGTGFSKADVILEERFSVPRISPAYLEPENSLAIWNEDGSITVWVSSQHPFTDQFVISEVLGLPVDKVQVKSAVIGGAFGGKEDPSLAILAALGAWHIEGSVLLLNDRKESFLAHPKRHPAQIHLKVGARRDGTLTALEANVCMDTGAYASYGPAVGIILTETLTGAYRIPNVTLKTKVVYTNSPLSGAMRGFGSPQSHFALESMLDILASELKLDPLELRRKNILHPGDRMFTGVLIDDTSLSLPVCLDTAQEILARYNSIDPSPGKKKGVGMALAAQSMGLGAHIPDDSTHRLEWLHGSRTDHC